MNPALKWKLIAGFLLVFVAGAIAGVALAGTYARHVMFEFHHPGHVGARMKEQFRAELSLTPEQVAKISPIIDKTAADLAQVRHDTGRRVREIWTESRRQIGVYLTDEQRKKLQQMKERHHRWRHRHGLPESPPESSPATSSSRQEHARADTSVHASSTLKPQSVLEENSFALHVCAAADKKVT